MSLDLSTSYMGLKLDNPCVLSASPLTARVDSLQRFEDAGAAAAVLPSVFQDQVEKQLESQQPYYECRSNLPLDSLAYDEDMDNHNSGLDGYLGLIHRAKETVSIPVIGSLNATAAGDWASFARSIQSAGVDALELNVYFVPSDPDQTARDVENRYMDVVSDIVSRVTIPVSVKLGPYFTSLPNFVGRLRTTGIKGIVLFNRYLEPDIDVESNRIWPRLDLSRQNENRLPFRWVAILSKQIALDYAISSGIHSSMDVIKGLMAGTDVVMMASILLQHGPARLRKILDEISDWLEQRGCESINDVKGALAHDGGAAASREGRSQYLEALVSSAMTWRMAPSVDS